MKIKTIVIRLDYAEKFDIKVNAAMAEGWMLSRRTVLQPPAQPNDNKTYFSTMLYAELVKPDEPTEESWEDAVRVIMNTCAGHDCDDCPMCDWCAINLKDAPSVWSTPEEVAK